MHSNKVILKDFSMVLRGKAVALLRIEFACCFFSWLVGLEEGGLLLHCDVIVWL